MMDPEQAVAAGRSELQQLDEGPDTIVRPEGIAGQREGGARGLSQREGEGRAYDGIMHT